MRVLHGDGEDFITMSGVLLDLGAQLGIPEAYGAVVPAGQYIFR